MSGREQEAAESKKSMRDNSHIDEVANKVTGLRRSGGWIYNSVRETLDKVITRFDKLKSALASEDIFYGSRSKSDVAEGDFEEIERLARESHDIRDIADDRSIESLEIRFRYLVALERIAHNLEISKLHSALPNEGSSAESILQSIMNQHWAVIIKFKKFFAIKSIMCLRKNDDKYHINRKNFHEYKLTESELRREYLRQQIRLLFAEAAEIAKDRDDFVSFARNTIEDIINDNDLSVPQIPEVAPELFKDRSNRDEDAVAFIRRVYEPWLGKGLIRPHIKSLDPPLYNRLYYQGVPDDFKTLLPVGVKGRKLSSQLLSNSELLDKRLKNERARAARRYMKHRP